MTDTQALSIHLVREDEEIRVLSWQVVSTEESADPEAYSLPVWDGELP